MGSYTFKHVGKTASRRQEEQLTVTQTPFGILTPLQPGVNELFVVSYSLADQVHDNFRNLVLTNHGERLFFYEFGANLRPLTTEYVSQDSFDVAAIERISNAVSRWMPYIVIKDYESVVDRVNNKNTAVILLTITYDVPALGVRDKSLEITLYVI